MNKETRVSPQMTACSNCWTIGPLARTRRAELPIQERCHVIRQALTDEPPVHRRLGRRTTLAAGQQRHQHEIRQQRQHHQAHIFERLVICGMVRLKPIASKLVTTNSNPRTKTGVLPGLTSQADPPWAA